MAKLKRASDGHLYIRGPLPWRNSIVVWQVSREAERRLKAAKVAVETKIPANLLRELIDQNLIYTGGGGTTPQEQEFKAWPLLGDDPDSLPLTIVEGDERYDLVLLLPPIPSEWIASLDAASFSATLATFGLQTSAGRISAAELIPIRGGARITVRPSVNRYAVAASGRWPKQWNASFWTTGARGLDKAGTLFSIPEEGGLRLAAGTPVHLGSRYLCLVRDQCAADAASSVLRRSGGSGQFIASIGGWRLLYLSMPDRSAPLAKEWCRKRGHDLVSAPWSLSIAAPVPRRTIVDGTPVFGSADKILLAAKSRKPHLPSYPTEMLVERQNGNSDSLSLDRVSAGPLYCSFLAGATGPIRVRITDHTGALATTRLWVDAPNKPGNLGIGLGPAPLGLRIWSGQDLVLDCVAFDTREPAQIPLDVIHRVTPNVTVTLPDGVHVDVSWTSRGVRGTKSAPGPAAAASILTDVLERAGSRGTETDIVVDAGSFGALILIALPIRGSPDATRARRQPQKPEPIASWLAAVGAGLSRASLHSHRQPALLHRSLSPMVSAYTGLASKARIAHGIHERASLFHNRTIAGDLGDPAKPETQTVLHDDLG